MNVKFTFGIIFIVMFDIMKSTLLIITTLFLYGCEVKKTDTQQFIISTGHIDSISSDSIKTDVIYVIPPSICDTTYLKEQ